MFLVGMSYHFKKVKNMVFPKNSFEFILMSLVHFFLEIPYFLLFFLKNIITRWYKPFIMFPLLSMLMIFGGSKSTLKETKSMNDQQEEEEEVGIYICDKAQRTCHWFKNCAEHEARSDKTKAEAFDRVYALNELIGHPYVTWDIYKNGKFEVLPDYKHSSTFEDLVKLEREMESMGLVIRWLWWDERIPKQKYYISKSSSKKHGKEIRWHSNRRISKITNWENGKKEGPQQTFSVDGLIEITTNWNNGMKNGPETWKYKGQRFKSRTLTWKNNKFHGESEVVEACGVLKDRTYWFNDEWQWSEKDFQKREEKEKRTERMRKNKKREK